jgi:hypothetical protein
MSYRKFFLACLLLTVGVMLTGVAMDFTRGGPGSTDSSGDGWAMAIHGGAVRLVNSCTLALRACAFLHQRKLADTFMHTNKRVLA